LFGHGIIHLWIGTGLMNPASVAYRTFGEDKICGGVSPVSETARA
jgi:hypothetical protein